jgi:hypothetical protein
MIQVLAAVLHLLNYSARDDGLDPQPVAKCQPEPEMIDE